MRVLFLGNNDGGLYNFRKELIERLLSENCEVAVSTPYGDYIPMLKKMGAEFIRIEYNRKGKNPWSELKLLLQYSKILKRNSWDVVLLYTIKPTLYAGFWCKLRKIPYIANITGLSPVISNPGILNKLCFMIYRRVLPSADKVYFQNKDNLWLFRQKKAIKDNSKLIPGSGVNLKEHSYEPYEETGLIRILFVGRITKLKGIDELLEAIKQINRKNQQVIFEFIGQIDDEYKKRFENLNQKGKIVYYGSQKCPHDYVKKAQAVIMPSYGEGMSNVLLEGASCGRALLASNVSGCKEIVKEGVTGFLFPPRDVPGIVKAIEKFLSLSYEERKQMGIEGRKHVEKYFSREIIIEEYINQIHKICKEK